MMSDTETPPRASARRWGFKTVAVVVVLVSAVTWLAMQMAARDGVVNAQLPTQPAATAAKPAADPFASWATLPAPDLVLLLSGQQYGFLNPCGCSEPQYGGLPRRWNLMQGLKARGWPVLGVDLGDLIETPAHRTPQTMLKYETAMKALDKLGYLAVSVGLHETEMPFLTTIGQYALNAPSPRLIAANLQDRDTNFAGAVANWTVGSAPGGKVKVGVTGIIGPTVQKAIPGNQVPALRFDGTIDALNTALKEMAAQQPEVRVLLYQGNLAEAKACASRFQDFQIVLCQSKESEPTDRPERVKDSEAWVLNVGHKGRYVGVVGLWKTGNPARPFEMKYELVMLGPEYETKAGEEKNNAALQLLEAYTRTVRDSNFLAQFPQRKHPLQIAFPGAEYVGSAECKSCHRHAYEVWENHPHAHAYDTLVTAKKPELRQFDGECIVCHTVGFGQVSGYESETKTPQLREVGCENCHGPGSLHVQMGKKTPESMLALMNPYRWKPGETPEQEAARLLKIDLECQKCHDVDNDVHWNFKKKWPAVIHRSPKNAVKQGQ